jgi:flagellar biosynthetic protein FliO
MGDTAAGALPTLGWGSLAMSFASLGVVCLLAYVALKWLAGRGVGRSMGAVKVLARCPLEPRRSVYLIETAGRCFLVGVGDGPMSLLAEVDAAKVHETSAVTESRAKGTFADALARVLARPGTAPTPEVAPTPVAAPPPKAAPPPPTPSSSGPLPRLGGGGLG